MNDQNPDITAKVVPCPECDTPIQIVATSKVGTILECAACATECEIINLDPFQIAPLEEEK